MSTLQAPYAAPNVSAPGRTSRRPWQRYLAEFLGTFALVFIGCGSVIVNRSVAPGEITHLGVSAAFGLVVAAMIYALGRISAAHMNPAVTFGFAVSRRFPWRHVPAYWAAQMAGAIAASSVHGLVLGHAAAQNAAYGATMPADFLTAAGAVVVEVVLTFLLMLVVVALATDRRVPGSLPGAAIGITVLICALFGGPLTGASMNPARSLGPAVLSGGGSLEILWIYIFAPIAGAVAAAVLYELLRDGQLHARGAPEDLLQAMEREPGLARMESN